MVTGQVGKKCLALETFTMLRDGRWVLKSLSTMCEARVQSPAEGERQADRQWGSPVPRPRHGRGGKKVPVAAALGTVWTGLWAGWRLAEPGQDVHLGKSLASILEPGCSCFPGEPGSGMRQGVAMPEVSDCCICSLWVGAGAGVARRKARSLAPLKQNQAVLLH